MTPEQFVKKWSAVTVNERGASQAHFLDLCALLGEPTPLEADPQGIWYRFEAGARRVGGGDGWADVWKRGCFAWEYKGKGKDLDQALLQLQRYAAALASPPLLIVSDLSTIRIHTRFTNSVEEVHVLAIEDLLDSEKRALLKAAFSSPDRLKPGVTRHQITSDAATKFAEVAQSLIERGFEPQRIAHFVNKLVFCMFAEDIGLLRSRMFTEMLERSASRPESFPEMCRQLFAAMQNGGNFGTELIDWFNGGLFSDDDVLPLNAQELFLCATVAELDWSAIDPSIFGTMFERGLDPKKRAQLGAQYTDPQTILRIIVPVVIEPLRMEWASVRPEIVAAMDTFHAESGRTSKATKAYKVAEKLFRAFLERLSQYRVLDPACGSGNFLYLALQSLKDFEHEVILDAEQLGLAREFTQVGPEAVLGIEINEYAAELARVTIWIGELQWRAMHGYQPPRNPVLRPLNQIECRDALLTTEGLETSWPTVSCIVGNPPFLGNKKLIRELTEDYVTKLRAAYKNKVSSGGDLVTYWFYKAHRALQRGECRWAGLVATNSISGGKNRLVLQNIKTDGVIYNAWQDEDWVNDGAAVRVSMVCFAPQQSGTPQVTLDGTPVEEVFSDLTARGIGQKNAIDFTTAKRLLQNSNKSFQGVKLVGAFEVEAEVARSWLQDGGNPNGRPNSDVLRRWGSGKDITERPRDSWVIDFGLDMPQVDAAQFHRPFEHVRAHVKPKRDKVRREGHREYWWRHGEPRPGMRDALSSLSRYIATNEIAKHRLFVFMDKSVLPSGSIYAIARDDSAHLGILQSRVHDLWTEKTCTWLGVGNDPRYTLSTTYEAFPFPEGQTPDIPSSKSSKDPRAQKIAAATDNLLKLRQKWLNPDDMVESVPEVVPGYPPRAVAKQGREADLASRTLTSLYNERPQWLLDAHQALDIAVIAAYGWDPLITNEQILERLFELNGQRAPA